MRLRNTLTRPFPSTKTTAGMLPSFPSCCQSQKKPTLPDARCTKEGGRVCDATCAISRAVPVGYHDRKASEGSHGAAAYIGKRHRPHRRSGHLALCDISQVLGRFLPSKTPHPKQKPGRATQLSDRSSGINRAGRWPVVVVADANPLCRITICTSQSSPVPAPSIAQIGKGDDRVIGTDVNNNL